MDIENSDYTVVFSTESKDGTIVVTSFEEQMDEKFKILASTYDPENKKYSVYLNEGNSPSNTMTVSDVDMLATNTQNDIDKVMKINAYNRKLINKDDIIGKTVEAIDTNINTDIKLRYDRITDNRNNNDQFTEVEEIIKDANESIKLKSLTRNCVSTSFIEGNWIAYLRHEDNANYKVDIYPLGVCEISDYDVNGDPIVLFNITNLRQRLSKTYKKTKKNTPLFFKTMEDEVKANYPEEVYNAFINKEKYAILNPDYTGVIRINNQNRKYGVSPIFRTYLDLITLDTFANSDRINAKAKSKKIIHQCMNKEIMGANYNKQYQGELAYAHENFMQAFKNSTVVVTTPPTVKSIEYIEPKVEMTSKDTYNIYRSKVLSTLGVQFLMDSGSQTVSTASISVTQLMRTINKVTEQLEEVLFKWYRQILIDNDYPVEYAPKIDIIDSEQLEANLKISMATLFYSTFNASLDTCFNLVGLDVGDEAQKRLKEKELGYEEIFKPRLTAYTNSSNSSGESGRPSDTTNVQTEGKRAYDKEYNKNRK